MAPALPKLPPFKAFAHVVYEHRAFASCVALAEQFLLPSAAPQDRDVVVQDMYILGRTALLTHVRNLITFYCTSRAVDVSRPARPDGKFAMQPTDVLLEDFGIERVAPDLLDYVDPISVHVGHITAWRDLPYRTANESTPHGLTRQWRNWDDRSPEIVDGLFAALDHASSPNSAREVDVWSGAFAALRDACAARRADRSFPWPRPLEALTLLSGT